MARSRPPSNTRFFWPTQVHILNISIGSAVFAQLTAEGPYTVQWVDPSLLKISHSHEVSGPHLTYFPWTHPNAHPRRHFDRFSRFAGLTSVTDRQTDRPHYSTCNSIGRIYVCSTAMRPKIAHTCIKSSIKESRWRRPPS